MLWPVIASAFFDVVVINTGPAIKQSALIVGADLVVVASTADKRQLYWYRGQNSYQQPTVMEVPEEVIFVDSGLLGAEQVLLFITRDQAIRVQPDGQLAALVSFDSMYQVAVTDEVPVVDFFRDINADGLDDFIVPSFRGYDVLVQLAGGQIQGIRQGGKTSDHTPTSSKQFADVVKLKALPLMDMSYNQHPWYQSRVLFEADMNLDGAPDLVFWHLGNFHFYPNNGQHGFDAAAQIVTSPVPLDFDGVDGMSVRMSDEDQSNRTARVLHGISDLDGDRLPDLVSMTIRSEGVLKKRTRFEFYDGVQDSTGHLGFAETPGSTVESDGIQYDMKMHDLNADGTQDLVISSVELGLGKIISALLTSSVKIDLGFYPRHEGRYETKPAVSRTVTATFSLSTGDFWLPSVLILDATGDGRSDLLVQDDDTGIQIFQGIPDKRLFSGDAVTIKTPMPRDPELISKVSINDDGIQDLLIRIPPPLGKEGDHQVVLLISTGEPRT